MGFVLKYLQRSGKLETRFINLRRDPKNLSSVLNKLEFKIPLGFSEADAIKRYPGIHESVEEIIRTNGASLKDATLGTFPDRLTPTEEAKALLNRLSELGVDPEMPIDEDAVDPRDIITEHLLAASAKAQGMRRAELDEVGNPVSVDKKTTKLIQAMYGGIEEPEATLTDAVRLYTREQVTGDEFDQKKAKQRIENIVKRIEGIVGQQDIPLSDFSRDHARGYRDERLKTVSVATVKREFNTIVAIINHALTEYDLQLPNPFASMKYPKRVTAKVSQEEKGKPFPDDILQAVTDRVVTRSRRDVSLIWQLLAGTGCRLNEIAGLRVEEVIIEHDYPHLIIQENRLRRIKNISSKIDR